MTRRIILAVGVLFGWFIATLLILYLGARGSDVLFQSSYLMSAVLCATCIFPVAAYVKIVASVATAVLSFFISDIATRGKSAFTFSAVFFLVLLALDTVTFLAMRMSGMQVFFDAM